MIKFLYAAYAVTWVIHLVYVSVVARGYKRVKEELKQLDREHLRITDH